MIEHCARGTTWPRKKQVPHDELKNYGSALAHQFSHRNASVPLAHCSSQSNNSLLIIRCGIRMTRITKEIRHETARKQEALARQTEPRSSLTDHSGPDRRVIPSQVSMRLSPAKAYMGMVRASQEQRCVFPLKQNQGREYYMHRSNRVEAGQIRLRRGRSGFKLTEENPISHSKIWPHSKHHQDTGALNERTYQYIRIPRRSGAFRKPFGAYHLTA